MNIKILFDTEREDIPKELSFNAEIKSEKDIPAVLRELADFMDSEVIEDKELI